MKILEIDLLHELKKWSDGPKYVLVHSECVNKNNFCDYYVGNESELIDFISQHIPNIDIAIVYVVGSDEIVYNIRKIYPNLNVIQVEVEN